MKRRYQSVAEILRRALPPRSRDRIFSLELIGLKWASAVGKELAARSEPASFEQGILTVRVADAAWGRMILKLQKEIRARLNEAMGFRAVKRLRFVKDGKPIRKPVPVAPPSPPVEPVEPPAEVQEAAQNLNDPDLRALVIRTATRYLATQAAKRR